MELEVRTNPQYNNKFIMIIIGLLFSRIGTSIYTLALPLIAYDLTGSGVILGSVFAVEMLPFIILLPFGGVLIDRFDRRKIMITADLSRMVFISIIPCLHLLDFINITVIFIFAFLLSSMSFFVDVSLLTIIPKIVSENELTRSNARIQIVENLSRILGPVLAGILIGFLGHYSSLFINSATYFIMALCIISIGKIKQEHQNTAPNILSEMKEGFLFLWNRSDIRAIALISFLCNFGMGIFLSTYVYYLRDVLDVSSFEIGIVSALGGVFGISGGLVINPIIKRFNKASIISVLLILGGGIGALLIAIFKNWVTVALGFGIWGGSITVMAVILTTYKQKSIPSDIFGRVEGSLTSLSYLALPLSGFIGGILISNYNGLITYITAGSSVVIAGLINLFSPLRSDINMRAEGET